MSADEIRSKFRPMEELKKDLAEMELSIKTDLEVLDGLLERYRNPALEAEERVNILTDVEYYVHQVRYLQPHTVQPILSELLGTMISSPDK